MGGIRRSRFTRAQLEQVKQDFYAMKAVECADKWGISVHYLYGIVKGRWPKRARDERAPRELAGIEDNSDGALFRMQYSSPDTRGPR